MADALPEVSVVIVSYMCRGELAALLDDLDGIRTDLPIEVLVVDNASTDGTPQMVNDHHLWVELEASTENLGFGRANNRAIRRAGAPLVLVLNPDTRLTTAALTAMRDEMRRDTSIGILSPRVVDDHGRDDPNTRRGFPTVWGTFCAVTGLTRVLRNRASQRYVQGWVRPDEAADVEAVSGAVMLCRADTLAATGGFDERFFMYGEDIDLCLRARKLGWRVRYWPGATVIHLGGRSGMSPRARRAWATSIGELHRLHRPGWRGRLGGTVSDLAGRVLSSPLLVAALRKRSRAQVTKVDSNAQQPSSESGGIHSRSEE